MSTEDAPERAAEPMTLPARPGARRADDDGSETVDLPSPPPAAGFDGDTVPIADLADDAEVATAFRGGVFAERYQRGDLLGTGGMGEVRALADRVTGRVVAMKTLRREREVDGLRRFAREARIQAQLEHPAVVPVYDVGVDGAGAFYFTMKRVRGESLGQVLARLAAGDAETARRYSRRKLLTVLSTVAMTLEYAHRRGVVHRDLKPSNVMLGAFGEVYVLDWGLADVHTGVRPPPPVPIGFSPSKAGIPLPAAELPLVDSSLRPNTETGQVLGTPGYAAPEQIRDPDAVDHRADVYALGVMLYEALTFTRLHTGANVAEVFASTLALDGASARERAPSRDVPPELDRLARAATRRDPRERPESAAAFARGLEAFLDGDRDVEARRRLAASCAESASAALVAARAPGADEPALRAVALREVTTALGLDPDSERARALLVRLLTEPSPSTVAAAELAHQGDAIAAYRVATRNAIFALFTYALYVPLLFWMGVRHWWMLGGMAGSITALIGVTYHYHRRPPADLRLPLPHLAVSTIALASGVVMFGPLVLLPSVVIANGVAYVASMRHRAVVVTAAMLAVVIVPVVLQAVGAVPPWYTFDAGGLRVVPWLAELPETPTLAFLTLTNAVVITACLVFVSRLRRGYVDAERRLRVQAYQLAQLAPPEKR